MPAAELSRTQEATVKAALLPTCITITDIAKARGVTRQSAGEILAIPAVQAELARREQDLLDKARGFWASLDKLAANLSHAVATMKLKNPDPEELGKWIQLYLNAKQTEAKLEAAGHIREEEIDPQQYIRGMRRAIKVGVAMGQRGSYMGVKLDETST